MKSKRYVNLFDRHFGGVPFGEYFLTCMAVGIWMYNIRMLAIFFQGG